MRENKRTIGKQQETVIENKRRTIGKQQQNMKENKRRANWYSWFSRDVTKILKSKSGGLQNFYLLLRKDYLKIYLDILHSFYNRTVSISAFSSCVTSGGPN